MKKIDGVWQPTVTDQGIYGFFGEYRWLSNFHVSPASYAGIQYPSSEHAYQAAKTLDLEVRQLFLQLDTPGKAKRFGQAIEVRPYWDRIKIDVMSQIVFSKFLSSPDLAKMLLATGDLHIEETNYWNDKFWGVCDEGLNHLGRILMRCRLALKSNTIGLRV